MKFSDSENQEESLIEMTPLIDVVFLLLIFFMVTTTFSKESSLKINLPESAQTDQKANTPNIVEVFVTEASGYAVKGPRQSAPQSLVNGARTTLLRAMQDYSDNADESLLVVIRADKLATHEAVVQVMDVSQQLGLNRITFATQKATE